MKRFCEIEATDLTERALRSEIAVKGYLLVRGVLPRAEVKQVLGDITQVLSAAGWLQPEHQPIERVANMRAACGDPDPDFKRWSRAPRHSRQKKAARAPTHGLLACLSLSLSLSLTHTQLSL